MDGATCALDLSSFAWLATAAQLKVIFIEQVGDAIFLLIRSQLTACSSFTTFIKADIKFH